MTQQEKQENALTDFQEFAKLNDKVIRFEKPTSKYLNGRIAIMAAVKLFNEEKGKLKPEIEKELEELAESFVEKANQEIENATQAIQTWLTNLIKAIYNYKNLPELDEEKLKDVRTKVMKFINDSGTGLSPEIIYLLVTTFCI